MATLNQAGVTGYRTPGQGGRPTAVAANRAGRYVRVQLTGQGIMSLAEVEVYAAAGGGVAAGGARIDWVVSDQLRTSRMVIDQTGGLAGVRRHDYLPFGEEIGAEVGGRTQPQGYVGDNLRQRWALLERDFETGLDYAQNRYYSSTAGRFTSVDPQSVGADLNEPQSWHGYSYALNNPLLYGDPSGLAVRVCDKDGNCATISDEEANKGLFNKKWQRENGHTVKGGKVYQNGEVIGTYGNLGIDGAPFSSALHDVGRRPIGRTVGYLYGESVLAGLSTPVSTPLLGLRFLGEALLLTRPPEESGSLVAGSITTESETRNGALREAKRTNGVPVTQNPRVITPNSAEGAAAGLRPGENIRLYEYRNIHGQRIWVREDGAVTYPDGGRQGAHFNSGPAGGPRGQKSLTNHHFWRRR